MVSPHAGAVMAGNKTAASSIFIMATTPGKDALILVPARQSSNDGTMTLCHGPAEI